MFIQPLRHFTETVRFWIDCTFKSADLYFKFVVEDEQDLDITISNQLKSIGFHEHYSNSLVNENTPPSMASGCIYLYIKHNKVDINKKHISDVCKISEVTINKCYKKLLPHIDKLIL